MPIPFKPSSLPSTENKFLSNGKSSTQTKRLVFRRDTAVVRYSWITYLHLAIFALFFVVPIIVAISDFEVLALPFLIIGSLGELIILACFIYCLYNTLNLPVFDMLNGRFYPQGRRHAESAVSTQDIDHLQLLEMDMCPGSCYELDAVMKNGDRLHIIAHGGRTNFMKDAKQLAECLVLSIKDENGEPFVDLPGKGKGPLVPGGTNFQAMHLVFRQDSISVQATWKYFLFSMIFVLIGLSLVLASLFVEQKIIWPLFIFGSIWSLIVLWAFFYGWKKQTAPLFDMVDGMFYPKGFTRDGSGILLKQLDHLEILKERVYNKNSSYDAYELNVVLKDGSRYNVMDHGNAKHLWADAHALADKLSLPLVDAQNGQPITEPPDETPKVSSTSATSAPATTSVPAAIGGFIFLTIFGLMFFGGGSAAAWVLCIQPMSGVIASGGWTPTPARIVSSQLERGSSSKGGSSYRVDIHYEYDINGSRHSSGRYDFFRSSVRSNVGVGAMRKIVKSLPPGAETTCLVNPANPDEAVISRKIPWFNGLFMLFPLPFLFIGGITITATIKSLFTPKAKVKSK